MAIAKSESILESRDGSFAVPSQSRKDVRYEVKALGNEWVCTCPDFFNRADSIAACKHIHPVRFWIASRVELEQKPQSKVFAEDSIQCERCGSIRVIKFGTRKNKPEMITLTLDLYFSNMSLAKIARSLNDNFGMNLGGASVYRWVNKYVPTISEYVNSLAPQLSDTWQADELFVKMKGARKSRRGR